jgi:hypothetical protein
MTYDIDNVQSNIRDLFRSFLLATTNIEILQDQQSVGKRNLDLMDTVNAKKRWTTIYYRVKKFLKESHVVTRIAKERASF